MASAGVRRGGAVTATAGACDATQQLACGPDNRVRARSGGAVRIRYCGVCFWLDKRGGRYEDPCVNQHQGRAVSLQQGANTT